MTPLTARERAQLRRAERLFRRAVRLIDRTDWSTLAPEQQVRVTNLRCAIQTIRPKLRSQR